MGRRWVLHSASVNRIIRFPRVAVEVESRRLPVGAGGAGDEVDGRRSGRGPIVAEEYAAYRVGFRQHCQAAIALSGLLLRSC